MHRLASIGLAGWAAVVLGCCAQARAAESVKGMPWAGPGWYILTESTLVQGPNDTSKACIQILTERVQKLSDANERCSELQTEQDRFRSDTPSVTMYRDWTLVCAERKHQYDCRLVQEIDDITNEQAVSELWIMRDNDRGFVFVVMLPLNVQLDAGVRVKLDGTVVRTMAYATCTDKGCVAFMPLTEIAPLLLKAKGAKLVVRRSQDHEDVDLQFSLEGLNEGWKRFVAAYPLFNMN